jgi:hypothetical protein
MSFYRAYLRLNVRGLPDSRQLTSLSPFLSSELVHLFKEAGREQAKYIREHPGEKPPWVEGDLFSSSFEGATSFRIGPAKVDGGRARVSIHLASRGVRGDADWTDTLVLTRTKQGWRVWNILYNGGESLRSSLSERW